MQRNRRRLLLDRPAPSRELRQMSSNRVEPDELSGIPERRVANAEVVRRLVEPGDVLEERARCTRGNTLD